VYLGAVVVLVTAMQAGVTPARVQRLQELLGVSVRTLKRWRAWWRTTFVATAFWRVAQGHLIPPVRGDGLPASLLERFLGSDERSKLVRMLRFLCPLTTATVSLGASLAMAARDPQTMRLVPSPPRS
jgi:hypothetical protein